MYVCLLHENTFLLCSCFDRKYLAYAVVLCATIFINPCMVYLVVGTSSLKVLVAVFGYGGRCCFRKQNHYFHMRVFKCEFASVATSIRYKTKKHQNKSRLSRPVHLDSF